MNSDINIVGMFKPGQLVRLKSGGPRMTVNSIERCTDGQMLMLVWCSADDNMHACKVTDVAVVTDTGDAS